MWPKNLWKRIRHLMQQHETPRKGHSTINLHKLIKSKRNPRKNKIQRATTPNDRRRMTYALPPKTLNSPEATNDAPRVSPTCRQSNNFRLIRPSNVIIIYSDNQFHPKTDSIHCFTPTIPILSSKVLPVTCQSCLTSMDTRQHESKCDCM